MNWSYLAPILLLCCSNIFMTFAWVRRDLPLGDSQAAWANRSGGPI